MVSQHSSALRSGAVGLALVLWAYVLFSRFPGTGFVFDEQEAVLANPYLQGHGSLASAFRLDFWGLPAGRSIGSYRPLPNLLWRALGPLRSPDSPLVLQLLNPLVHGTNGLLVYRWVRRRTGRWEQAGWAALLFVSAGVCTEAVASVVGLADLLVVSATLLALAALELGAALRELCVFVVCLLGLLSKETMLAAMLPLALSVYLDPAARSGQRTLRAVGLALAMAASLVAFLILRKVFFQSDGAGGPLPAGAALPGLSAVLAWIGQPSLPIDRQNNPLLGVAWDLRLATALRIYGSNLLQMVLPFELCADYSFPRIVPRGFDLTALLGGVAFFAPLVGVSLRHLRCPARGRQLSLVEFGLLWTPLTALPTANLLLLLPTIRAERLLSLPLLGVVLVLVGIASRWAARLEVRRGALALLVVQALSARAHALHYQSDVLFWRAAALGRPASAKAHLNLGVMLGARGDAAGRLRETERAVTLAPSWALAHVYLGDAKCRGAEPESALSHYLAGFALEPNSKALAALALQCLWVTGQFDRAFEPLERVAARAPDGWLSFLLAEVAAHGSEQGGLPLQYRPRGYNQTP